MERKNSKWRLALGLPAVILGASACDAIEMAKSAPPLSQARFAEAKPATESPSLANLAKSGPVASPIAPPASQVRAVEPTREGKDTSLDVVFGGDVVPQARMVSENPEGLLTKAAPLLQADGFVFNLEGPVGSRRQVSKDKNTLAFATPADWLGKLLNASHASAFGAANNHACDLEQEGVTATAAFARERKTTALGIESDQQWKARVVAERDGRRVCALSWTTFLNDDRKRHDTCRRGRGNLVVARASLDTDGYRAIRKVVTDERTWEGCDVRIANVHGGIEYRAQSAKMMYLAHIIAPAVDAIVFAHTHVPDGVELLDNAADTHARQRKVPVFRSLGNLLSNQGAAWSEGMSTALLGDRGAGDPIRTVWTRVAMLARMQFSFEKDAAAPKVAYGYDLAFLDRTSGHPVLAPLDRESPIGEQLRRGSFGALLDDACRRTQTERSGALPCRAE